MGKLTSIFLLTCLCCALLGYHLVFHFQLAAVKSEMKAFLRDQKDHKELTQIILSKPESNLLDWEDENEFRYRGEMYDVIQMKSTGDTVTFYCIADEKETVLFNQYQKNNKWNGSSSFVFQLITATYILPTDHLLKQPEKIIESNFKDHSPSLKSPPSTVPQQPPNFC
jgi:hypothetical protein